MCLDVLALRHNKVRTETHPYSFHKINIREPFIATQPLVVKKRVDSTRGSSGKEFLRSPYQGTAIILGQLLTTTMTANGSRYSNNTTIEQGFHAYLYSADRKDWRYRNRLNRKGVVTIYGVIPAGAKYYIGSNKEVVAESIIYYRNLPSLRKAFNIKKFGEPVRGDY